jgi:FkbM family methyltransferase
VCSSDLTKNKHNTLDAHHIPEENPGRTFVKDNPDNGYPGFKPADGLRHKNSVIEQVDQLRKKTKDWKLLSLPENLEWLKTTYRDSFEIRYTEIFDKNYGHYYERYFPLMPKMTVIDAGASHGMWTIHAAKKIGSEGRVIALEPSPFSYDVLQENVELNALDNVITLRKALWKVDGPVHFELGTAYDLGHVRESLSQKENESIGVTLDQLMKDYNIKKINFLKIDIEGGEEDVLSNWKDMFGKFDYLVVETHNNLKNVIDSLIDNNVTHVKIEPIQGHPHNFVVHADGRSWYDTKRILEI